MENNARLDAQLSFLLEIDKLKNVLRRNLLIDSSRRENTAEHSWHIAILAGVLREYSTEPINLERVLLMLLVHDIVEIDAGDTYAYDETGYLDKSEREHAAAERIFSLLPEDQHHTFNNLWLEFEAVQTAESRFANTVDRLMPIYHNYSCGGTVWKANHIRKSQVLKRIQPMQAGSQMLWQAAIRIVEKAVLDGYIIDDTQA
jgi:putative hydrolases of HD superfamily